MKVFWALAPAFWLCAAETPTGFPFTNESLLYTVNWPSGLSLGEAQFRAQRTAAGWDFSFDLAAAIPTYRVAEQHTAAATAELCSLRLAKESARGNRKTREETLFDGQKRTAFRATASGGKSEMAIPACARDALTFLYFTRRELGQGRVPPAQETYFGAAYQVRLEYTGAQNITVGNRASLADRVTATSKGPRSDWTFEMFFARDAARTPLLIRVPFALGSFSLELLR
jgi:hypothetical protein